MSTKNNGGPAFPLSESSSSVHNGMTMRQYYKAAALQLIDSRYTNAGNEAACAFEISRYAGMIADAMLAEEKEDENET